MAKRVRRKGQEQTERTAHLPGNRSGEEMTMPLNQWQQGYGNAYLQRLAQHKEESAAEQTPAQVSAEPDRRYEYKGHVSAQINRDKLQIDLKKIVDLHSLGVNRATLPGKIKQWLAVLAVALGLDSEPFQHSAKLSREGILELPLGDELIAQMTKLMGEDPEKIEQVDPQLPFGGAGLEAEAELCFDGAELDELPLDHKEDLIGRGESEPGLFVVVRLRGSFPAQGLSDDQDELLGTLILRAEF